MSESELLFNAEFISKMGARYDRFDFDFSLSFQERTLPGVICRTKDWSNCQLDVPFSPFSLEEAQLLTENLVSSVKKIFMFRGIKGQFEIRAGKTQPDDIYVSPWSKKTMFDDSARFPISLDACFDYTDRVTPRFELRFPKATRKDFLFLVGDWDIASGYHATQYAFLPDNLQDSASLVLPRDPEKISSLKVIATSQLVNYPFIFGKQDGGT